MLLAVWAYTRSDIFGLKARLNRTVDSNRLDHFRCRYGCRISQLKLILSFHTVWTDNRLTGRLETNPM